MNEEINSSDLKKDSENNIVKNYKVAKKMKEEGHYKEAESLYNVTIEIYIKNYGEEHPEAEKIYNNLICLKNNKD